MRRPTRHLSKSLLKGRRTKGAKLQKGKIKIKDCLACSTGKCEQRWDEDQKIWVGYRVCKNCRESDSRRILAAMAGE